MATASNAADQLREARKAQISSGDHPAAEAEAEKIQEDQDAEFHGPTTAMLDALQPFNIEGGEGQVHQMKARQARMAAREALKDAKRHLVKAADVRPVIRQHPWLAVGGSAALGFAAAMALIPSDRKRAAARLRTLERSLVAEMDGRPGGGRSRSGTTNRLIRLGWRFAQPTLLSLVTGALSGAASGAATGAEAGESGRAGGGLDGMGDEPPMTDVT